MTLLKFKPLPNDLCCTSLSTGDSHLNGRILDMTDSIDSFAKGKKQNKKVNTFGNRKRLLKFYSILFIDCYCSIRLDDLFPFHWGAEFCPFCYAYRVTSYAVIITKIHLIRKDVL